MEEHKRERGVASIFGFLRVWIVLVLLISKRERGNMEIFD